MPSIVGSAEHQTPTPNRNRRPVPLPRQRRTSGAAAHPHSQRGTKHTTGKVRWSRVALALAALAVVIAAVWSILGLVPHGTDRIAPDGTPRTTVSRDAST